jgi:hypothetical protein
MHLATFRRNNVKLFDKGTPPMLGIRSTFELLLRRG